MRRQQPPSSPPPSTTPTIARPTPAANIIFSGLAAGHQQQKRHFDVLVEETQDMEKRVWGGNVGGEVGCPLSTIPNEYDPFDFVRFWIGVTDTPLSELHMQQII